MSDAKSSARRPEGDTDGNRLQPAFGVIPPQYLFTATVATLVLLFNWPLRWLISGAPLLSYSLIYAASQDPPTRVLAFVPLWVQLALVNLSYSVAATSWLLYWFYATTCYPALSLSCLFQFKSASRFVRKRMRSLLQGLQFTQDRIAFFDLPALEIDVDVEGLMCIRGISFSISSLTLIAHGVEVGIKLSDDMEVAIVTDDVVVRLFRGIDIGDVYGNVKGGEFEMTFGKLAKRSRDAQGNSLMMEKTPLLVAAAANGDTTRPGMPRMLTTNDRLTNGNPPKPSSVKSGFKTVRQVSPDDESAHKQYEELIDCIARTSIIRTSRLEAEEEVKGSEHEGLLDKETDLRAAICSQLHDKPTIAHPAQKSIKVTTLQHLSPPHVREFLHRLPLLLRLLLAPIAYFHPVTIKSITAGGSGHFLQSMLSEHVLPEGTDTGVKNLKQRISTWLTDANFVFQASTIKGQASVPVDTAFDIETHLNFDDIMAYRTLPREVDLKQIVRLGGADARITVPSCLLPHHEHLLPPKPTRHDKAEEVQAVKEADGMPKTVQALEDLKLTVKDEVTMQLSTHVKLPASFDQSLLDFVAALVKATKIVEIVKEDDVEDDESIEEKPRGFKDFTRSLKSDMKDGFRRVAIDVAANDRWIAKMVGKITRKLEVIQGDVGYTGAVPISLEPYRKIAEKKSKLMP